jgi:preprotein translocase subunit SecA
VADSESLSAALTQHAVPHQVLNARIDGLQTDAERRIIEAAGQPGQVTVATHMAGRGTDITLSQPALKQGGLHVINTQLNASRRVDRQLEGRSARQGQPGSCQRILCWQDKALAPLAQRPWLRTLITWLHLMHTKPTEGAVRWVLALRQALAGHASAKQRWALLQQQRGIRQQTAWAGRDEWD